MSDYIPTTAEVRDAYSSESSDSRFANRAFDLWLARYKAKVITKTEERIIKLLESKLCPCVESDSFPSPDDDREEIMKHMNCSWDAMMIEYHVALIKGEQK